MLSALFLYGPGGPTGVGIEVEFPFVLLVMLLPVALAAIVLPPLVVWLLFIVACASADRLAKFSAATAATTNTPTTAPIVKPNLNILFM